jgi:hypothetical protein
MRRGPREAGASYVIYDPPTDGFPYLGVLFRPERHPRVFMFRTERDAETFLTASALAELPEESAVARADPAVRTVDPMSTVFQG